MGKETLYNLEAEEILDSRGRPTLLVRAYLEDGLSSEFGVPSGASKGRFEAKELRDGGKDFSGFGVRKAEENVKEKILPRLKGVDIFNQGEIDRRMIEADGSEDKSNLGANAIIGVSGACLKLAAKRAGLPLWKYVGQKYGTEAKLPFLAMNFVNGGKHSNSPLAFQEYLAVFRRSGREKTSNLLDTAYRLFEELKREVARFGIKTFGVGDEGGLVLPVEDEKAPLELLSRAINKLEAREESRPSLGLDVAASTFYEDGRYITSLGKISQAEMISYLESIVKEFGIFYFEDPLFEDDFQGFGKLKKDLAAGGESILLIGDDLTVTNPGRIKMATEKDSINAVLIKPNQIGTISETIEAVNLSRRSGLKMILSHRSGETNDDFISDMAVGLGLDGLKAGSICRGERIAKYNRLMEIEKEMQKFE